MIIFLMLALFGLFLIWALSCVPVFMWLIEALGLLPLEMQDKKLPLEFGDEKFMSADPGLELNNKTRLAAEIEILDTMARTRRQRLAEL